MGGVRTERGEERRVLVGMLRSGTEPTPAGEGIPIGREKRGDRRPTGWTTK